MTPAGSSFLCNSIFGQREAALYSAQSCHGMLPLAGEADTPLCVYVALSMGHGMPSVQLQPSAVLNVVFYMALMFAASSNCFGKK